MTQDKMANKIAAVFEIEDVIQQQDGAMLLGRCSHGTICVGDTLVRAVKCIVHRHGGHQFSVSREVLGQTLLTVKEIQYARQRIDELSMPHSGAVYVVGNGLALLAAGREVETAG